MKRKVLTTATAVLFAASAAAFAADTNNGTASNQGTTGVKQAQSQTEQPSKNGQQGQQNTNAQQNPAAPQGFVLLEENTVFMMAREPQQHLLRAHEQMEANNPKAAAEEVRLAAAYLKMQAARPGEEDRQMLAHWEHRLYGLAQQIQNGDVKTPEFTRDAAGVNYALARYFDERAQRELGNENHQVAAGYDLKASADAFEQSLDWCNKSGTQNPVQKGGEVQAKAQAQQSPQEEIKAIADARTAGDELIAADNLANNEGQNAQPAASKIGPNGAAVTNNNANKNEGTANAAAAPDARKACSELSKAIQDRGDTFKTQEGNEKNPQENGQKASANQK